MTSNYGTGHGPRRHIVAAIDNQAERAVTAIEQCQKMRDEIRSERDAAQATVGELIRLLCQVESALIDAHPTAEVRLAQRKVRAAIAKATGGAA